MWEGADLICIACEQKALLKFPFVTTSSATFSFLGIRFPIVGNSFFVVCLWFVQLLITCVFVFDCCSNGGSFIFICLFVVQMLVTLICF